MASLNMCIPYAVVEGDLLAGLVALELRKGEAARATNDAVRQVLADHGHAEALVVGDLLLPDLLRGILA